MCCPLMDCDIAMSQRPFPFAGHIEAKVLVVVTILTYNGTLINSTVIFSSAGASVIISCTRLRW
jgi:hypothetical protein